MSFQNREEFPTIKRTEVSVVLPVYSGRDSVERCINSILKQDFEAFELIILDDASKDESVKVIKQTLSKFFKPLKFVQHEKNQGIAYTLNQGINLSKGKYVLIIHQDCELVKNDYITKVTKALEKNSKAIAICGKPIYPIEEFNYWEKIFMIHSGHSNEKSPNNIEQISFSEHKCDIFKKEILLKDGGFNQTDFKLSGEDQVISFRLKEKGYILLKYNNLRYIQRYGKSVASLRGFYKKVFIWGIFQSKVIIITNGKTLLKRNRTTNLDKRIRNRLLGTSSSFFFSLFAFLFIFTQKYYFIIPAFAILVIRMLSPFLTNNLIIQKPFRLLAGFTIFLADIVYFGGLIGGLIISIRDSLSEKLHKMRIN